MLWPFGLITTTAIITTEDFLCRWQQVNTFYLRTKVDNKSTVNFWNGHNCPSYTFFSGALYRACWFWGVHHSVAWVRFWLFLRHNSLSTRIHIGGDDWRRCGHQSNRLRLQTVPWSRGVVPNRSVERFRNLKCRQRTYREESGDSLVLSWVSLCLQRQLCSCETPIQRQHNVSKTGYFRGGSFRDVNYYCQPRNVKEGNVFSLSVYKGAGVTDPATRCQFWLWVRQEFQILPPDVSSNWGGPGAPASATRCHFWLGYTLLMGGGVYIPPKKKILPCLEMRFGIRSVLITWEIVSVDSKH